MWTKGVKWAKIGAKLVLFLIAKAMRGRGLSRIWSKAWEIRKKTAFLYATIK
jgi:hypothetical protein